MGKSSLGELKFVKRIYYTRGGLSSKNVALQQKDLPGGRISLFTYYISMLFEYMPN
jgi:hypothetical protein